MSFYSQKYLETFERFYGIGKGEKAVEGFVKLGYCCFLFAYRIKMGYDVKFPSSGHQCQLCGHAEIMQSGKCTYCRFCRINDKDSSSSRTLDGCRSGRNYKDSRYAKYLNSMTFR